MIPTIDVLIRGVHALENPIHRGFFNAPTGNVATKAAWADIADLVMSGVTPTSTTASTARAAFITALANLQNNDNAPTLIAAAFRAYAIALAVGMTGSSDGGILTTTKGSGGTGYAANNTFTINTGTVAATGRVLTVSSGVVSTYTILTSGTGYTVGNGKATTATSGSGTGLTINVTGLTAGTGYTGTAPAANPILTSLSTISANMSGMESIEPYIATLIYELSTWAKTGTAMLNALPNTVINWS